jgi:hypothetical protein
MPVTWLAEFLSIYIWIPSMLCSVLIDWGPRYTHADQPSATLWTPGNAHCVPTICFSDLCFVISAYRVIYPRKICMHMSARRMHCRFARECTGIGKWIEIEYALNLRSVEAWRYCWDNTSMVEDIIFCASAVCIEIYCIATTLKI